MMVALVGLVKSNQISDVTQHDMIELVHNGMPIEKNGHRKMFLTITFERS